MIKRQFYHLEHANKDEASDSSSSSDSELEAEATDESEDEAVPEVEGSEDDAVPELQENDESCSTSSGLLYSLDSIYSKTYAHIPIVGYIIHEYW
jgi:hypothetical protein